MIGSAERRLIGRSTTRGSRRRSRALHDADIETGESEGMMALFRGAISVFKNPASHREVTFEDPTLAAEVVLFADLLIRLLGARAATLGLNR